MTDSILYPGLPAAKITCVTPQERSGRLRHLIGDLGIHEMTVEQARRTLLRERRIRIPEPVSLYEELVEIIRFRVDVAAEERVIASLTSDFGFGDPGRGSIVSQRINLLGIEVQSVAEPVGTKTEDSTPVRQELAGLACVVPRGDGVAIARVLLNAGLGAPAVTYAQGVASRARLGLIRVTIPAEKEIVTILVSRHDIGEAFQMVSEVLRINRPGAGFFYWFPVHSGVLDARIWVGRQPHVASMEQVIAALDLVTGDTVWRRKADPDSSPVTVHPVGLLSYTIHGTELDAEHIVNAALAAGAGGATLSRVHRELPRGPDDVPAAAASSELIIPETMLPRIHEAVMGAGLMEQRGFVEIAEVGGASGFRAP